MRRSARRRAAIVAASSAAAALALPAPAAAHLVTSGLGPVYDGISHLLMSFDDLLPVVALALLGGLAGAAGGRRVLFVLPVAWLAAGMAGHVLRAPLLPGSLTAASLLLAGGLTAADRRLSPAIVGALGAAVGALHGWLNGTSLALAGVPPRALLGICGAVFALVALVAALAARVRAPWARIAVRIAGSWIAAIGLLAAGWALREASGG